MHKAIKLEDNHDNYVYDLKLTKCTTETYQTKKNEQ